MVSSVDLLEAVSVVFAIASVVTGAMGIVAPVGFSKMFGIPVTASTSPNQPRHERSATISYIALMGVRQLGTGVIILVFAYQSKWTEIATILAIIGILVAGTDGIYISRAGSRSGGQLHAIPGALIAALAAWVLYTHASSMPL